MSNRRGHVKARRLKLKLKNELSNISTVMEVKV